MVHVCLGQINSDGKQARDKDNPANFESDTTGLRIPGTRLDHSSAKWSQQDAERSSDDDLINAQL